jgi:ribose/xylose/arabinose/galactoside ABC-type transport system permease subunit
MIKQMSKTLNFFGPFLGLIFVYAIFHLKGPEQFHSLYNFKTILTQAVIIGIAALGMTVVIISAGIDLSSGSLIALGGVVTALILRQFGGEEPGVVIPLLAALAGILACTCCGMLNGIMISGLRIVPFIVTLGMMQIARGVSKGLAGNTTVNTPTSWLSRMMTVEPKMDVWYSVAPGVWLLLFLLVFMFVLLRYTTFGRHIFAVGSNEDTARLCGIHVGVHRVYVYAICGALTGVASVLGFSVLGIGDPTGAIGFELDVIAAVVIGGGSFSGGEGSVIGSVVGAVIIAILRNGCPMIGVENYIQNIVIGAIIIVAVGLDQLKQAHQR